MLFLLVNQTFHPDVVSTAQHLTDLALGLVERGHQVVVVTGRRGYDQQDRLFPKFEIWRGIQIYRVSSTSFGKGAKWRRAADFGTFMISSIWRLIALPRPDAIVALTSPPLISFVAALLSVVKRSRYYYWVMDLNPDEAIAAGWLRPGSLLARVLEKFSRFSLRRARHIFALDPFAKELILKKGIPAEQIAVIAPWSHDESVQYDSAGRTRFRKEHGLEGRFVVMYSGNHSPCHPLTTLLEAARVFHRADGPMSNVQRPTSSGERPASNSEVRTPSSQLRTPNSDDRPTDPPTHRPLFCFVGGGSGMAEVKRFVAEHQLSNVRCLPYQPLDQLAGSLSAADLHVVVMGDPFVGVIHPCKIYNILQVGAPVLYIGPPLSHITEILKQLPDRDRWSAIRHGDVDGVIQSIVRMAGREAQASEPMDTENFRLPAHTSDLARQFSKDALMPRMIAFLEDTDAKGQNGKSERHERVKCCEGGMIKSG